MLNTDLLMQDFEVTDEPGLSTFDPRFQEIAGLMPEARFIEAAQRTEEILGEGILDIRLLGYFLYGVFLEQGPMGLHPSFEGLTHIVTNCWDAVGPAKKKDKIADKSLVWLFKNLLQLIRHHEDKQDDTWTAWLSGADWDSMEAALEPMNTFRRMLPQAIENPSSAELFGNLVRWVEEFQRLVYVEPEPEPEEEEEGLEDEVETGGGRGGGQGRSMAVGGTAVEGSYPLQVLLRKLEAFDLLVRRNQLPKAALVADDIGQILEEFDPKVYFPSIFSGFYRLMSQHIETIAEYWEEKESLSWQAMEQLYRVDLDAFLEA